MLQLDVYCLNPKCNKRAALRGHNLHTWNQQFRTASVIASPGMANIGTSFLALDTRRLAVGRKATAAAVLLSFKVDNIAANAKFRS